MKADICMQCRNKDGILGCFLKQDGQEISPCFNDMWPLCVWMAQNGWSVGWDYKAYKDENKA